MSKVVREDITVIILAAGAVLNRLPALMVSCESPALIPIHTKSASRHLIEFYQNRVEKILLVVEMKELATVRRRLGQVPQNVEIVGSTANGGVCDTLEWVFATQLLRSEVIVNLVTTIISKFPGLDNVQVADTDPWILNDAAAVRILEKSLKFYGKEEEKPAGGVVFTGVFRCKASLISQCFPDLDSWNDLMSVVKAIAFKGHEWKAQKTQWIDCGHQANFSRARASLITSRSFNALTVDSSQKTITKTSTNKSKLRLEYQYLERLPPELGVFFPRMFSGDFSSDNSVSYSMEYCPWPTASEYLLFWNLPLESWWRFFSEIDCIIKRFRAHEAEISFEDYFNFLVGKTLSRVKDYISTLPPELAKQLTGDVSLNGTALMPMVEMLEKYREVVSSEYDPSAIGIFHGDMCFNNILSSWDTGRICLIDPRGSFGEQVEGLKGDYRYDLAKLNHSACGGYDWIVSGQYRLELGESEHWLLFPNNDGSPPFEKLISWLCDQQSTKKEFIEILTGGLFLSMCPLHKEDPRRQAAFFLNGRKILTEKLGSNN